jgi:hypothetical protein
MLVAAFAVGRSQQLIYLMQLLIAQNRIPDLPIYLDSPMAVDATEIFCKFSDDHDLSEGELKGDDCMFHRRNVHLSRSVAESKEINRVNGPAIVISSSGMMTGGRILHHLRQRLDDPRNTIVIGGYQAEGTRGRSLLQGAKTIRIHGRDVPVRAAVTNVSGLSGHAATNLHYPRRTLQRRRARRNPSRRPRLERASRQDGPNRFVAQAVTPGIDETNTPAVRARQELRRSRRAIMIAADVSCRPLRPALIGKTRHAIFQSIDSVHDPLHFDSARAGRRAGGERGEVER